MNDNLKVIVAEIDAYAEDVINGRKTFLQIERHLMRIGYPPECVCMMMELIRDEISRRKKGNGKAGGC